MITPTTCFTKIAQLNKPIRIISGGSHAGKTYSNLMYLIFYALKKEVLVSIVMESIPALKRAAYKDFVDILKKMNLYDEKNHNLTDRKYTLGKSTFEFFGADNPDALRGGRRDILYISECNRITFDAFNQLSDRTHLFTLLDYNPVSPFWVDSELIDEPDVDFIRVTYKDNEFLNQKTLDKIHSWYLKRERNNYWGNYWRCYGLGLGGSNEGAIYTDWSEIDSLPINAQLIATGLDWGYSNDYTAVVSLYRYDGELIVDEKLFQKGLLNSQIANLIKQTDAKNGIIYCDSAEPKSIGELKAYGLQVLPVVKGQGSINYGIQLIQEQPFKVTSNSKNVIRELQNYTWLKNKTGEALNVPIDSYNDSLDALRYIFLMKFGKKSTHFNLRYKPRG